MLQLFLDKNSGVFNSVRELFGLEAISFLSSERLFKHIYVWSGVWKGMGWSAIIYIAALSGVDKNLLEAAEIDGASRIQSFFKITVPLLKPVTVFLVITSTIYAFQMFDEPNLLFTNQSSSIVGGPKQSCLTIVWNFYNKAFGPNPRMGYASAMSCVLFLIIVIISVIGLRLMNGKEEK